jgi:type I restriction enzyme R subunit
VTQLPFTESVVEQAALAWLESIGWRVAHGPEIAPDTPVAERRDHGEVVLAQRLRDALARLNPALPADALEDAFRKITRPEGADLVQRNRAVHRLLVDGVTVEYRDREGAIRGAQARVIDFEDVAANDWLAVNQFGVVENKHSRRPDVVLFVNGLPLAVLELKNAADEDATIWTAFQQLQTYKTEVPSLFSTNAVLVVSDGVEARIGTVSAGREWFKPWRTIEGEALADTRLAELQVVIEGAFERRRLLDLVRDFIAFEDDGSGRIVRSAVESRTLAALRDALLPRLISGQLRVKDAERIAGRVT